MKHGSGSIMLHGQGSWLELSETCGKMGKCFSQTLSIQFEFQFLCANSDSEKVLHAEVDLKLGLNVIFYKVLTVELNVFCFFFFL